MEGRTFHCSVVTPEGVILECDARFVAMPAHDGEIGILRHRAPLVIKLGVGRLRIETAAEKHVLLIDGGFAQMVDNRLSILTEQALRPEEIDRDAARESLVAARGMKARDEALFAARQHALDRARAELRMASGGEKG